MHHLPNHPFSCCDIFQVFNPFFLETHAQPFVLGLGMEAFLVKVNRRLVPLQNREHSSTDFSGFKRHHLENRPIYTSAVLGIALIRVVKQRCQVCDLFLRDDGKLLEQCLPYAFVPVLGFDVEVFKL